MRHDLEDRILAQDHVLSNLNRRVVELTEARHAVEETLVADISTGDTVESLKSAIDMAQYRNLIGPGFRVRIDQELGGPRFTASSLLLMTVSVPRRRS